MNRKQTMLRQIARKALLGLTSRQPQRLTFGVARRWYHENVIDHFENRRNEGRFDESDPSVGTGLVGSPACGDVIRLQIKVEEGTGQILDVCFKAHGCGAAIASSSVVTEWVKGKAMEEALTIKNRDIARHLSLPPVKLHCSMLVEDAIKVAVNDYKGKRAARSEQAA